MICKRYVVFTFKLQSSGKTYTIGGTDSAGLLEDEYGVILRAVKQLFQIMEVIEPEKKIAVHRNKSK